MRKLGPAKVYSLSARLPAGQLLSQSSDLILILDESYTIREVSESFLSAFGIRKDELEDQKISTTFIGPDLIDRIRDPVRLAMAGKESVVNAWIPVQKERRAFRIRTIPLAFGWGDKGIVVMFEDRTGEILAQEENALLADLLNASPAAIIVHDFEGHILYSNKKNLDLHGYSLSEFLNLDLSRLTIPDSEKLIEIRMKELQKKGESSFEVVHLRKDGRQIPLEVHAKVTPWGDREVIISIATDITERKRAEEELHESEHQFATVFRGNPVSLAIVSAKDGVFVDVNDTFLINSGYTREEVIGSTAEKLGIFVDKDAYAQMVSQLRNLHHVHGMELRCRIKSGTILTCRLSSSIIIMRKKPHILSTIEDITEQKEAEDARQQQTRALAALNALAIELASMPAEKPVEPIISKTLMVMSGAVVTWFSDYDPVSRTLRVTDMEIAPGMLENVATLLGKQPFDMRIPVSNEMYREITRDIIGKRRTLTEISFGQIPPLVSTSIQKLVGIDRFIGIACIVEGRLYGTSMLAMKAGEPDPPAELLESFAHIVAVSLRRRQAENALRESGEKFRALFENANDAIRVHGFTPEGLPSRFSQVNENACRMSGYTREELLTLSPMDLDEPEEWTEARAFTQKIIEQGHLVFERTLIRKDGKKIPIEISSHLFVLNNESVMISLFRDITGRRATESAFHAMVTSMVGTTGIESLDRITENIGNWLGADGIIIGEISPDGQRVEALAMRLDGKKIQDFSYTLKGTPCENTAEKGFCVYPDEVCRHFPESRDLQAFNIRGYAGTPLRNFEGQVVGILCIFTREPLSLPPSAREIIEIIAVKAAAEIERRKALRQNGREN
jgi:PAS domain S-box-containing protein